MRAVVKKGVGVFTPQGFLDGNNSIYFLSLEDIHATVKLNTDMILVSLKKESVIAFVFWSNNYAPFIPTLKLLKREGYNFYLHFTITGYPNYFETNVPPLNKLIDTVRELGKFLSPEQIIDKVYKEPYPNRFLASFAPFISKNIDAIPSFKKIASDSFTAFIDIHVLPYKNAQSEPIALVGSIAFYFKDLIQEIASQKKLHITKIISNPIYDLAKYHKINIYEA